MDWISVKDKPLTKPSGKDTHVLLVDDLVLMAIPCGLTGGIHEVYAAIVSPSGALED